MRTIKANGGKAASISTFVIEKETEISNWIDKKIWRQGIATTALKDSLKIEQVRPTYARLVNDNYGSPKKIEKWGFVKIAVNKEFTNTRQAEIEAFFNTITQ